MIRFFDEWIDRVRDHGLGWTNVNDLKERKIESLKTLKSRTDAFLEDQKKSGLYALRVEATARRSALNSLMIEACCSVKLKSRHDAQKAAEFIRFMTRMHSAAKAGCQCEISVYFLSCISKRLAAALANPSLR